MVSTNNFIQTAFFNRCPASRPRRFLSSRAGNLAWSVRNFVENSNFKDSLHTSYKLLLSILERDLPEKQFSLRSGHLHSSRCLEYPVIRELCISAGCQTYVTSHFPAQTLCKLNSVFCRQNKLILDLRKSLSLESRASFALSALTRLVTSVGSIARIRLRNKRTSIVRMSRIYATIAKPTEK